MRASGVEPVKKSPVTFWIFASEYADYSPTKSRNIIWLAHARYAFGVNILIILGDLVVGGARRHYKSHDHNCELRIKKRSHVYSDRVLSSFNFSNFIFVAMPPRRCLSLRFVKSTRLHDLYIWGVTHWGTSWDYVLTDIRYNEDGYLN